MPRSGRLTAKIYARVVRFEAALEKASELMDSRRPPAWLSRPDAYGARSPIMIRSGSARNSRAHGKRACRRTRRGLRPQAQDTKWLKHQETRRALPNSDACYLDAAPEHHERGHEYNCRNNSPEDPVRA